MKKLVAAALAGVVMVFGAYAEITFGMYGQGGLNLIETNLTDSSVSPTVGIVPGFSPNARIGVSVKGTNATGNMGFQLDVNYNGTYSYAQGDTFAQGVMIAPVDGTGYYVGSLSVGDNAKIWGQWGPVGITFGRMCEDDLRASMSFDDWGIVGGVRYIDNMFRRFDLVAGAHVDFAYKGLYAAVALDAWLGNESASSVWFAAPSVDAEKVYKGVQAAIAYTIPRFGTAKVQYIGETKARMIAGQNYTSVNFMGLDASYNPILEQGDNGWKGGIVNAGFHYVGTKNLEVELGSTLFVGQITEPGAATIDVAAVYTGIPAVTLRFGTEYTTTKWESEDPSQNATTTPLTLGLDGKYKLYTFDLGATTKAVIGKDTQNVVITPFVRKNIGQWFGGVTLGCQFDMTFTKGADTAVVMRVPFGIELGM